MDRKYPPLPFVAFVFAYALTLSIMLAFSFVRKESIGCSIAMQLAIIAALGCFFWLFPDIKKSVVRSTKVPFYTISFGIMTWFICMPLVLLNSNIANTILINYFHFTPVEQVSVSQVKQYLGQPLSFTFLATAISVFVPTIEELLVRGFMQTFVTRFLSIKYAIPLTSIIFALLHYSPDQGLQNFDILSSLFILSCFLGYIYERENSILAPIGLHCFFNAVTLVLIAFNSLIQV